MKLSLEDALRQYQSNVYKAALSVCRDPQDAEDITQETFLTYYRKDMDYESAEHIKAWLLRVAINKSRDLTRSFWRRQRTDIPDFELWLWSKSSEAANDVMAERTEILSAVMSLPDKCRIIIHLFYYEDYTVRDIANLLGISEGNVKSQLCRGRKLLKKISQEDFENGYTQQVQGCLFCLRPTC